MRYSKPNFWGYDTGRRTIDVECFCGKMLFSRLAYEDHMRALHPKVVRKMKKDGSWQQNQLEGWVASPVFRRSI